MNCPNCKTKLRKVDVKIAGAKTKAISYQCPKCDYFEFEPSELQLRPEYKNKIEKIVNGKHTSNQNI